MTDDPFKRARRERLPVKLALSGPSKSGKTYSALMIARGVVGTDGRIAVLDTEGGSSNMYADDVPGGYNVMPLAAPYRPAYFAAAIDRAVEHGYDAVVVDGMSPFWDKDGGVLSIVDKETKIGSGRNPNKISGWIVGTPEHQRVLAAITECPIHLICTMRVRSEWVMEQDDRGRTVPRRVGLAPVQRDGVEYEFTFSGMIDRTHEIVFEARGDFDGIVLPAVDPPAPALIRFGEEIAAWLDTPDTIDQLDLESAAPASGDVVPG